MKKQWLYRATYFAWLFVPLTSFFRFSTDLRMTFGRSWALTSVALGLVNLAWSSQPSASEGRNTCFSICVEHRAKVQIITTAIMQCRWAPYWLLLHSAEDAKCQ
jgi:hypothetical protein